ncbi:NACHT domain-containing protein [Acinetobacter pittii]|uniref:NACHT domain-containing protein n=1 Tax=Acinetobacter pittii TaxID=48296 RepID=UPI0021D1DB15|nr:NACHT domain-containing protein [Acinetobacter pittii]MCU4471509.1 NACHT domain-containing protein [Acinetobacter pittii]MCU4486236.1 NACHT domain-containing protein [Acinetobacter pittii]
MVEPVTITFGTLVLRPLITEICKDIYNFTKKSGRTFLAEMNIEKSSDKIQSKISKILMIRTIYDSKRPQHISEFYYPTKVNLPDGSIQTFNDVREIEITENLIIEGIVGHGKSMLMRHLTLNEILKKNSLPIFFELRSIQKTENLTDCLCTYLSDILEVELSSKNFDALAESGKITLFLDGFDELNKELIPSVISKLEQWSIKFPNMKIICSSRPYNALQNSPYFLSLTLHPYDKNDQAGFIQKLTHDIEISKQLVQKIEESAIGLQDILKTPLMLTLFVMTYQTKLQIALSISEFYRDIFDVLMNRHDYLKLPYEITRYVDATQSQLEDIFQEFCFYSKNNGNRISFDKQYFQEGLKESCRILDLKFDSNNIILELTKNICLILKEGNEYSFIHKSIQEFFVANLLRSFDITILQKFYTDMFNYENYNKFEVELKFLSEIDKLNYYKFLVIPSIQGFLNDIKYIENGVQPFLQSIFIAYNEDSEISKNKIVILFDFDYENKYGYVNSFILRYILIYIIHKSEDTNSIEIYTTDEKKITDFKINDLLTLKIKQTILSDKILDNGFITLENTLRTAEDYVRSKSERTYTITR